MSGFTSSPVIPELDILQELALWHVKVSKMLLLVTTTSVYQRWTQGGHGGMTPPLPLGNITFSVEKSLLIISNNL